MIPPRPRRWLALAYLLMIAGWPIAGIIQWFAPGWMPQSLAGIVANLFLLLSTPLGLFGLSVLTSRTLNELKLDREECRHLLWGGGWRFPPFSSYMIVAELSEAARAHQRARRRFQIRRRRWAVVMLWALAFIILVATQWLPMSGHADPSDIAHFLRLVRSVCWLAVAACGLTALVTWGLSSGQTDQPLTWAARAVMGMIPLGAVLLLIESVSYSVGCSQPLATLFPVFLAVGVVSLLWAGALLSFRRHLQSIVKRRSDTRP